MPKLSTEGRRALSDSEFAGPSGHAPSAPVTVKAEAPEQPKSLADLADQLHPTRK